MKIEIFEIFKNMFYVLDSEYDNAPNYELGEILSGMNPFLFSEKGSAVQYFYKDFSRLFQENFGDVQSIEIDIAYDFCLLYLEALASNVALVYFKKISKQEWVRILSN